MSHHGTQGWWVLILITIFVFVQYTFQDNVHEGVLCACLFPLSTRAAELFKSLSDFRKHATNPGRKFQLHRMGWKTFLLLWHIQFYQWTQPIFRGEWQLCSSGPIKWIHSQLHWNYTGQWGTLGILRNWVRAFFILPSSWPTITDFRRVTVAHILAHHWPAPKKQHGRGAWRRRGCSLLGR